MLETLSISSVLDVGANRGQFGMMLRGMGYKGWIVSFEPVQSSFAALQEVAKRHGPWRVFPYALGAANGQLEINVTGSTVFCSFLKPLAESRDLFPGNRVEREETVAVWRLDHVLESCLDPQPRIYLKIDTPGV